MVAQRCGCQFVMDPLVRPSAYLGPGHPDGGAGSRARRQGSGGDEPAGRMEKDLVLDMALRVRAHLAAAGVRVVMTRDTDRFWELADRPYLAARGGGDLFVSIHLNTAGNRSVQGIETFVTPAENYPPTSESKLTREVSGEAQQPLQPFQHGAGPSDPAGRDRHYPGGRPRLQARALCRVEKIGDAGRADRMRVLVECARGAEAGDAVLPRDGGPGDCAGHSELSGDGEPGEGRDGRPADPVAHPGGVGGGPGPCPGSPRRRRWRPAPGGPPPAGRACACAGRPRRPPWRRRNRSPPAAAPAPRRLLPRQSAAAAYRPPAASCRPRPSPGPLPRRPRSC